MNFQIVLFHSCRFFCPYLIIDSLSYFKGFICIFTVHFYCPLCLIISSLTSSALGFLMNMWNFRPPARWAHELLWWPRAVINNVVFWLAKTLSLFLQCLSEIKFTAATQQESYSVVCLTGSSYSFLFYLWYVFTVLYYVHSPICWGL